MLIRRVLSVAAVTIAMIGFVLPAAVSAHGELKPLHGGVVSKVNEIHFEQVAKGDAVMIYVYDHGKAVATKGASGKLVVLNGAEKTELALTPSGENILQGQGAKFASGTRSVATIQLAGGKPTSVRFAIK